MLAIDLDAYAAAAGWSELPLDIASHAFEATIADPKFPGAILPRLRPDRSVVWYAVAPTAKAWRRLRPLLLSYAGPTITSFSGPPTDLDVSDPAELVLARGGIFASALLVPPSGGTTLAARALARLVMAINRAPVEAPPPSPSTGKLLSLFDMSLAAGNKVGAEGYLAILRDEWRLDVENLRFVEVRIAAAFREWPRLLSEPWFNDVCRVPKPAIIAQALLEALWYLHFEHVADDPTEQRRRYDGDLRAICLELLTEGPTAPTGAAAAIAALEADKGGIGPESAGSAAVADRTFCGWLGWITDASSGRMHDAAAAARLAVTEQPASSITTEAEAEALAAELQNLALRSEARASLLAALPELVRWLAEDPDYPRSIMRPFYDAALTIFTLLDERGASAREAMLEVLDALLSFEPASIDYRRHIEDAASFVVHEAGTTTAYWLIGLAERLVRYPAADGPARLAVLNKILASLLPITSLLTLGQRAAYRRVAAMANWPPLAEVVELGATESAARAFEGKVVALYTLTESAGRQARDALAEAFHGLRIELSGDHVCTPRLKTLAREADLFVVATASAKHAATDCIQRYRTANLPIAYAAGRGATSIVRAVEESLHLPI